MNTYIKWFVQDFMRLEYNAKETLNLWLSEHGNYRKNFERQPKRISLKIEQQLTIFDL